GLAFVRPAFNPTAHLITTVAGPLVTLVLWLGLTPLRHVDFLGRLAEFNRFILLFNLIPAFPMDGGRILRDTLWHWMSAEKATRIAATLSQVLAVVGAAFAIYYEAYFFLLLPVFIFTQTLREQQIVGFEGLGT